MTVSKNTIENIIIIIASVIFFNAIPNLPKVGTYFIQMPWLLLILSALLLVFRMKIIEKISFINAETMNSIIYILVSLFMFTSAQKFPKFMGYFTMYSWQLLLAAVLLVFFKDKIAGQFGG